MRRTIGTAVLATALASLTPSTADPSAAVYAQRLHAVHVNVFRPLGSGLEARLSPLVERLEDGTETELSMNLASLEVLVDTAGSGVPEQGGCIDIIRGSVIDTGCGPLTIVADQAMGTTRVTGEIASTEYEYIPDPFAFNEIGPSTITVDLTFTGAGPISPSPYGWTAAGVCGLPPETRGVFVDVSQEFTRQATGAGTLHSAAAGNVDIGAYAPALVEATGVAAGACL